MFGDKSVHIPEMEKFAKAGIACAIINYRFASDVTGVHHPALPNDIKAAVDFIAAKAPLWGLSANRFGLVGQSAGGHLALLTSYTLNNDERIKACASWAGVVNLLDEAQMKVPGGELVGKTYMGMDLKTYNDTLRYREASPYYMVTATSVPTFLLHGTKDIAVPYSSVVHMQQHLTELGVENRIKVFEGGGHLWFGNELETARTLTIEWFNEKL
jgi:acetyl esterase/lipase